jgi:hypothetical protein
MNKCRLEPIRNIGPKNPTIKNIANAMIRNISNPSMGFLSLFFALDVTIINIIIMTNSDTTAAGTISGKLALA